MINDLALSVSPLGDRLFWMNKPRKRIKRLETAYAQEELSAQEVAHSLQSWSAYLAHGDTWRLRQQIFTDLDLPYPLQ